VTAWGGFPLVLASQLTTGVSVFVDFPSLQSDVLQLFEMLADPSLPNASQAARRFVEKMVGKLYASDWEFQYDTHKTVTPLLPTYSVNRAELRDSLREIAWEAAKLAKDPAQSYRKNLWRYCHQYLADLGIDVSLDKQSPVPAFNESKGRPPSSAQQTHKRRQGRRRLSLDKERKYEGTVDEWSRYRESETGRKKGFCKSKGITVKELNRMLAWKRSRQRRDREARELANN
jgi:hypothetical protein